METMNTEQQRIAIAQACGWTGFNPDNIPDCLQYTARRADGKWGLIPDYLNDLNAMHEAVKSLPQNLKPRYFAYLCAVVSGAISLNGYSEATEATAAQRAKAFLRTLNLWKP